MSAIGALARTQLRRTSRSRLFVVGVLVALVLVAGVVESVIGIRTWTSQAVSAAIAWDVISFYAIVGFVLAALLGAWTIQSERRDKTWQVMLCKPVMPWQIVVGKFLGVMSVLGTLTLVLWAILHVLLAITLRTYFPRVDVALALQLISFSIPAALSLCLTLRFHPILAVAITLLLRYEFLDALFASLTSSQYPAAVLFVPAGLVAMVRMIAPSYEAFDLTVSLRTMASLLWTRQAWVVAYAVSIDSLLLWIATAVLRARELAKTL
ncbi:MAG TPA: ABC transporter permease subunit [Candidatus Polarisedimenticolaceae bacterium]|nr:ABC transporter permease subunit [Candidatus Polarisedimenticolaceae bacterium]